MLGDSAALLAGNERLKHLASIAAMDNSDKKASQQQLDEFCLQLDCPRVDEDIVSAFLRLVMPTADGVQFPICNVEPAAWNRVLKAMRQSYCRQHSRGEDLDLREMVLNTVFGIHDMGVVYRLIFESEKPSELPPAAPIAPAAPTAPAAPNVLAVPTAPAAPIVPAVPTAPAAPIVPAVPTAPTASIVPASPTVPAVQTLPGASPIATAVRTASVPSQQLFDEIRGWEGGLLNCLGRKCEMLKELGGMWSGNTGQMFPVFVPVNYGCGLKHKNSPFVGPDGKLRYPEKWPNNNRGPKKFGMKPQACCPTCKGKGVRNPDLKDFYCRMSPEGYTCLPASTQHREAIKDAMIAAFCNVKSVKAPTESALYDDDMTKRTCLVTNRPDDGVQQKNLTCTRRGPNGEVVSLGEVLSGLGNMEQPGGVGLTHDQRVHSLIRQDLMDGTFSPQGASCRYGLSSTQGQKFFIFYFQNTKVAYEFWKYFWKTNVSVNGGPVHQAFYVSGTHTNQRDRILSKSGGHQLPFAVTSSAPVHLGAVVSTPGIPQAPVAPRYPVSPVAPQTPVATQAPVATEPPQAPVALDLMAQDGVSFEAFPLAAPATPPVIPSIIDRYQTAQELLNLRSPQKRRRQEVPGDAPPPPVCRRLEHSEHSGPTIESVTHTASPIPERLVWSPPRDPRVHDPVHDRVVPPNLDLLHDLFLSGSDLASDSDSDLGSDLDLSPFGTGDLTDLSDDGGANLDLGPVLDV